MEAGEAPRNPEWLELGLRAALMGDARKIIESFYNDRQLFKDDEPPRDLETRYGPRAIHVTTLFGKVCIKRHYYHHQPSKTGRGPLDEKLRLEGKYSPALTRLSRFGMPPIKFLQISGGFRCPIGELIKQSVTALDSYLKNASIL